MINISTSCQNCIFAIYENNKQSGCVYNVPEMFEAAGATSERVTDSDKEFLVINRVCMYRRHEQPEIDVKKAILPKLNIVIIHKDGASQEGLISTLSSINAVEQASDSIKKIIVCHEDTNFKKIIGVCKKNSIIPTDIVMMIDKLDTDAMYDESFKRALNGYVLFINSSHTLDKDLVNILDYAINTKMQQVFCINEYPEIYMSVLYKYVKGNKLENIKDKINKLTELNDNTKFSWSQLSGQFYDNQ